MVLERLDVNVRGTFVDGLPEHEVHKFHHRGCFCPGDDAFETAGILPRVGPSKFEAVYSVLLVIVFSG